MEVLLQTKVTKIGDLVADFLREKTLIIFNDDVPDELHDMAVLHTKSPTTKEVSAGDYLIVEGDSYRVTSVGEKANETLISIGHCTIKFDGATTPDLPGTLHVEEKEIPPLAIDTELAFVRK
ncbi:PTS glucitol/sorbitol transporter subunit IIA [Brevibacillus humidisoli]|uniref:PTS glucitol/sorbitol transporter subunit IIA n=1 Tax=Brevibacillus humidisoli TaxID=2895522 RepID=UPI001E4CB1ED|nr:PTS glucitol/sorbitol transporter subunit IIA [Brevibacillus humidisoli]UFJ42360.1 PTS glucitol/sorbitol transporter subunit IIA [Brevibacillus humidisoli]